MAYQSPGMEITASTGPGGFFGALKRSVLSGDSFFTSRITAPSQGGWVTLAPSSPGDVEEFTIDQKSPLVLTRGAWLASSPAIELDTKFSGSTMIIGGEGLWTVLCSGVGSVVITAFGAMKVHEIGPGDGITVDTGHVVGYSYGMRTNMRKAGKNIMSSIKSGEGLVMDFQGPGFVITQSRSPAAFQTFLQKLMPKSGSSGGASGLGGLLSG